MVACKKIKGKKRIVCSGDLRNLITIKTRSITAPAQGDVNFGESFTTELEILAMVETVNGEEIFDGVNVIGTVTHNFYIRFIPDITFEKWLEFKSENYNILGVENLDERDEFYKLRTSKRGSSAITANLNSI